MLVHVTIAWLVFRLRLVERLPIGRLVANIVNKQLRKADKGLSPSCILRDLLTTSQLKNCNTYKHTHVSRTALIILYKSRNGERTCDWALKM